MQGTGVKNHLVSFLIVAASYFFSKVRIAAPPRDTCLMTHYWEDRQTSRIRTHDLVVYRPLARYSNRCATTAFLHIYEVYWAMVNWSSLVAWFQVRTPASQKASVQETLKIIRNIFNYTCAMVLKKLNIRLSANEAYTKTNQNGSWSISTIS